MRFLLVAAVVVMAPALARAEPAVTPMPPAR